MRLGTCDVFRDVDVVGRSYGKSLDGDDRCRSVDTTGTFSGGVMRRWLRRLWIMLNTPPIDVIAPPDFALRRSMLEVAATAQDKAERRLS